MLFRIKKILWVNLVAAMVAAAGFAQPPPQPAGQPQADWGRKCALSVCQFVFQRLQYDYKPQRLLQLLSDEHGYQTLDRLVNCLCSHCLKVDAQRRCPPKQLRNHLLSSQNNFIIMCTPPGEKGIGHALVAAAISEKVAVYDDEKGLKTFTFDAWAATDSVASPETIFLLISPAPGAKKQRNDLKVVEGPIDFKKICDEKEQQLTVHLLNTGETPLSVVASKSQCSCVQMNLANDLLAPKVPTALTISLNPVVWGPDAKQKQAILQFADKSFFPLTIHAEIDQTARFHPYPAHVAFSWTEGQTDVAERLAEVIIQIFGITEEERTAAFDVHADIPDLKLQHKVVADGQAAAAWKLLLRIEAINFAEVTASSPIRNGTIEVRSTATGRYCKIPLTLEQRSSFYAVPGYLLSRQEKASLTVRSRQADCVFRIVSVEGCTGSAYSADWSTGAARIEFGNAIPPESTGVEVGIEDKTSATVIQLHIPVL